jgi:GNAT superfamily N-acetyltransferase
VRSEKEKAELVRGYVLEELEGVAVMTSEARLCSLEEVLPMRELYREEMNCQITHDSIPRREGWTLVYLLTLSGAVAGYGLVAIAGPWTDKPTIIEYYVVPEYHTRVFDLFEAFVAASDARFIEIQTNATLLTVMLHLWSSDAASESIVFHDRITTALPSNGALLRRVTSVEESLLCVERRRGSSEWVLELDGETVATGGIGFHYNRPYGDIYMAVSEAHRRRGFGSYLVQELKRVCYEELSSIPCARCSPTNVASRKTLQKVGFVPCAHILTGSITLR